MRPIPLPSSSTLPSNYHLSDLGPWPFLSHDHLAVRKPPHISSAQVLRDLQMHFTPSKVFGPLLERDRLQQETQARHQPRRRRRGPNDGQVKMGHGGTLDPLATGVLAVGVGRGTKYLQDFLLSTKTYETVVVFGKGTDTYDIAGQVVASAPYQQVTQELVEEKLGMFRGRIKQVPPVYSSLRFDGIKAYEYVRSGRALPRELEAREMEVHECEMLEWYEGGTHEYRWPAEEVSEDDGDAKPTTEAAVNGDTSLRDSLQSGQKRKVSLTEEIDYEPVARAEQSTPRRQKMSVLDASESPSLHPGGPVNDLASAPTAVSVNEATSASSLVDQDPPSPILPRASPLSATALKAQQHTHIPPPPSSTRSPAPATRIRLTVSSGFYVRSFAHDLGHACGSLGMMASLVRSRQGEFDVGDALTYEDLKAGEAVWGKKIEGWLERWRKVHPEEERKEHGLSSRDKYTSGRGRARGEWEGSSWDRPRKGRGFGGGGERGKGERREGGQERERRNTSSEED